MKKYLPLFTGHRANEWQTEQRRLLLSGSVRMSMSYGRTMTNITHTGDDTPQHFVYLRSYFSACSLATAGICHR